MSSSVARTTSPRTAPSPRRRRGPDRRRLQERAGPGSYLQLTHFTDESAEAKANEAVLKQALGRGQVRTREEITRFFDGLEIVPPGIVFLPEWRPDEPVTLPLDPGGKLMLGGVGRETK